MLNFVKIKVFEKLNLKCGENFSFQAAIYVFTTFKNKLEIGAFAVW